MSWNWDHLRFFLALAEEGTLSGAARRLGVSHTTVLRRIRTFEGDLETRLFDRTPQGYSLTTAGAALHERAVEMKTSIETVSRQISGADAAIGGEVVITTTDTLAFAVLPRLLARLGERYPDLRFRLDIINRLSDIDNREADIAIRTCREPPERLIGRRIGTVRFAACAARDYVEAHGIERFPERTDGHRFVVLDRSYAGTPFHHWLDRRLEPDTVCTTINGFLGAAAAARAGMGIAVLPAYMLAELPDLVELPINGEEIATNSLWILSRADLRDTERVRLVRRYLYEALAEFFH